MKATPVSFNGVALNDSNYLTKVLGRSDMVQPTAELSEVTRSHTHPLTTVKEIKPRLVQLHIKMLGTGYSQIDDLNELFSVHDGTEGEKETYIFKDEQNSDKQWYGEGMVIGQPAIIGSPPQATVYNLKFDDPIWRSVLEGTVIGTISASPGTITITPGGNRPAKPVFDIVPVSNRTGGFQYQRFVPITNPGDYEMRQRPFNLAFAAGLDTAALIAGGKMQADGDDLRVKVNGQEVDRWFGLSTHAIGTTATYIWANLDLAPRIELILSTAIASSGAIDTISLVDTGPNRTAFKRLPQAGIVQKGGERFSYTAADISKMELTGVKRTVYQSTAEAHAAGGTLSWVQHEIWLVYGDSSIAAPVVDDTRKPMLNLTNSSNTVWDWDEFTDLNNLRSARWGASKVTTGNGSDTKTYTGNQTADADPATEMGMRITSFQSKTNKWSPDKATMYWSIYDPAGFTDLIWNGEKRRTNGDWPTASPRLEVSNDGRQWTSIGTVATPATAGSWTAFTGTPTSLGGTYRYARFVMDGAVAGGSGNELDFSLEDVTGTIASANVPQGSICAELGGYRLNPRFTNGYSGEWIELDAVVDTGGTVRVDCFNQTITYLTDNRRLDALLKKSSKRFDWLNCAPGTANPIVYSESGMGTVVLTATHEDRAA